MAKKSQLLNFTFPAVDAADFATIESGITASDFNSGMTRKIYGTNHGTSTVFTSATVSKAVTLVRSGIFQQVLKASETNYDYLMYHAYGHASLADIILVFELEQHDSSDLMSRLSDTTSNLLSYVTGMSGMLSDVQSAIALLATSNYLSAVHSDLGSKIGAIPLSVSASDMSDIVSRVWAAKYTANSLASSFGSMMSDIYSMALATLSLTSDVDSQVLLNASMISDILSAVALLATSNYLSQVHSDLTSQIGGITVTVTASDMSDIASRVWATAEGTRVDSRILVIQSNLSDVESAVDLLASSNYLSQVHSDIISAIGGITASVSASDISDIASAVWGYPLTSKLVSLSPSDLSDIRSAIAAGPAATVTASDISDIASAVYAILVSDLSDIYSAAQQTNSRTLVVQSLVSDVDSQVLLNASMISDILSGIALLATSNYLSQVHSDLRSQIGGITASVSASDISDIASAVWAAKYGTHSLASSFGSLFSDVYSRIVLTQSLTSDVQSALDSQFAWTSNYLSDFQSNILSYLLGISGAVSDVESQVDLLATSNYLSQVHSDLRSQISGITAGIDASDISDIASAVYAILASDLSDTLSAAREGSSRTLVVQSMVSDVDSQLLLNASMISDIDSQVNLLATSDYLSAIYSDLISAIGGITATLSASDISDIASAVIAGLAVTSFPAGAIAFTYTVTNGGLPVAGADVWISTDAAGNNRIWRGTTDAFGVARNVLDNLPMLDPGTYYFWKQLAGYWDDDNPDIEVVS